MEEILKDEKDIMSVFKDKTLMITGGTGSFGNAVLNGFLETDIKEIRIFSRDEKKQDDMRHEFQAKMPEASNKIKFFMTHNSAKSRRLQKLVKMSYDMYAEGNESDAIFLEKAIDQEMNEELREALQDLDDFLFGY